MHWLATSFVAAAMMLLLSVSSCTGMGVRAQNDVISFTDCPLYSSDWVKAITPVLRNPSSSSSSSSWSSPFSGSADMQARNGRRRITSPFGLQRDHLEAEVSAYGSGARVRVPAPAPASASDALPGDPTAVCGLFSVPFSYTNASLGSLTLFVKRFNYKKWASGDSSSQRVQAKKALLMLSGGPGDSGEYFEPVMLTLGQELDSADWDILYFDQRGSGRSQRLTCLNSQAESETSLGGTKIVPEEIAGCRESLLLQYPGGLHNLFSTDNSARDVYALAQALGYTEMHLYGISYGTLLTNRVMLVDPVKFQNLFTTSIVDGLVAPAGPRPANIGDGARLDFTWWDPSVNEAGMRYVAACAKDTVCSSKTGIHDPVSANLYMQQAFAKLTDGSCGGIQLSANFVRSLFGDNIPGAFNRAIIMPTLYRVHRCDPVLDVPALMFLMNSYNTSSNALGQSVALHSDVLGFSVGSSEMWEYPEGGPVPTLQDMFSRRQQTYISQGVFYDFYDAYQSWPMSPRSPFFNKSASVGSKPVLLMNGELDPQTPLWSAYQYERTLQSSNKTFVQFPGCVHGLIFFSQVMSPGKATCGIQLISQFVRNGGVLSDKSCVSDLLPPMFTPLDGITQSSFNTLDAYDGAQIVPSGQLCPSKNSDDYDGYRISKGGFVALVTSLVVALFVAVAAAIVGFSRKRGSTLREFNAGGDRYNSPLMA
eukprot:ANDGO_05446.mRNA.1 hypothetical protein